MFRAITKKKKKPKRVVVTTMSHKDDDQEDDDDDEPTITTTTTVSSRNRKRKGTKKKRVLHARMSFDDDDLALDQEKVEDHRKGKRKRSGGGSLGFGGAVAAPQMDNHQEEDDTNVDMHEESEPSLYGKDALEKLKSEQKYQQREATADEERNENLATAQHAATTTTTTQTTIGSGSSSAALPSFLPLQSNSNSKSVILTGDEALRMEQDLEGEPLQTTTEDALLDADLAHESSAWEAEVARRAGIPTSASSGMPTSSSSTPTATATESTTTTTTRETATLSKLRDQVSATLTQLQHRQDDLSSARARRQVELDQLQQEYERQQGELDDAGRRLDFYQELRVELAQYVGALREIQPHILKVQEAQREIYRDDICSWRQWQDDVVAVLHEAHLLDRVVGRQPGDSVLLSAPETTTTDEFGRDVKSQRVLERESRAIQRRKILAKQQKQQQQRHDDDKEKDDDDAQTFLLLLQDPDQTRERQSALNEALQVVLQQLEAEYTDLSKLIAVFDRWARTYPQEYQQCFASMSLADLASVLVQVDLCVHHHPLDWKNNNKSAAAAVAKENDDNEDGLAFPWLVQLAKIPTGEMEKEEDRPLYRMVDRVLIPAVTDVLDADAYDVASNEQSRSLSGFCQELLRLFPKNHHHVVPTKLCQRLVDHLARGLNDMSIPILVAHSNDNAALTVTNNHQELQEAIEYATTGQVRRLEQVLMNLLRYWSFLEDDLAEPLLDFVSTRFLFLLSSLDRSTAVTAFDKVWNLLKRTGWLDRRPDLLVQAAPIRAAVTVYSSQPQQQQQQQL